MSCTKYTLKQDDSIDLLCVYTDDDDQPIPLTNITIKSQIRDALDNLVDTFRVTITDSDNGEFVLTPTIDKLPVGTHKIDVMFIQDGKRITSETFKLKINKSVTQYEQT